MPICMGSRDRWRVSGRTEVLPVMPGKRRVVFRFEDKGEVLDAIMELLHMGAQEVCVKVNPAEDLKYVISVRL